MIQYRTQRRKDESVLYCKKCGRIIDDDSEFCRYCGTLMTPAEASPEVNIVQNKSIDSTLEKYPMALPAGSVLAGQYIIEKPVGQGGFGITYIANDHKNKQKVALKGVLPGVPCYSR